MRDYEGNMNSNVNARFVKTCVASIATAALMIALLVGPACSKAAARTNDSKSAQGRYIVQLAGNETSAQDRAFTALGGDIYRHLTLIHAVALELPVRNLDRLQALPFVKHVSTDGNVRKCDGFTVASSLAGTAYTDYGVTGLGVNVAVVDTGVTLVDDLHDGLANPSAPTTTASRIVTSISFVPVTSTEPYSTNDLCGHGTFVAGDAAGCGADSTGSTATKNYYGIARRAGIVNVRVLDQTGSGLVSTVISGIQWVVTNKTTYHIGVMNLSLGEPVGESYTADPLCQACEAAWKDGIVVVCAAGNEGRLNATQTTGATNNGYGTNYGSVTSPGNDPYVITVGATKTINGVRADDEVATYSGRGPSRLDYILKPDIIAPGNLVISTATSTALATLATVNVVPWSDYLSVKPRTQPCHYMTLSGTSMAAPVVSGAVALMLQQNPSLTPDDIKARLMISADKWTDPSGNADPFTYGAGYLDIMNALQATYTTKQYAMSPDCSEDASGNVYIDQDSNLMSSSSQIWGTGLTDLRAVWGTGADLINDEYTVSDSRAVWGTSVFTDRAVWGTTSTAVDLSSIVLNGE